MDRRTFLGSCGVAASIAVAGCGGANNDPGGDDAPEQTPTPTPTPTLSDQSLITEQTDCGSTDGEATVRFDTESMAVTVDGAVIASNPCHDASLAGANYDPESETLMVTVDTEARDEICTECIGRIDYVATVSFEGALPGRVTVEHGGKEPQTITEQRR